MPFTLAHPAAVVPLRRVLPLSALIVGSLSPDFEYLFRLAAVSEFSHTLSGVLYFCMPVGLLVLGLFHYVVKRPALTLLPSRVRQRLEPYASELPFLPLAKLSSILLALAVGAFTHVAWDSFTHEHGWVVGELSLLRASVFSVAGSEVRLYKVLQHGSTVAGLSLLAFWCWRWFHREATEAGDVASVEASLSAPMRRGILLALCLFTSIAGVSLGMWSASRSGGLRALQVFVVQSAIGGVTAFALYVLLFSLVYKARNHA